MHMEELGSQWQEEQENAEDDAEKYVSASAGENSSVFILSPVIVQLNFSTSETISSMLSSPERLLSLSLPQL